MFQQGADGRGDGSEMQRHVSVFLVPENARYPVQVFRMVVVFVVTQHMQYVNDDHQAGIDADGES